MCCGTEAGSYLTLVSLSLRLKELFRTCNESKEEGVSVVERTGLRPVTNRGTSLIRNRHPLVPYSRPMSRRRVCDLCATPKVNAPRPKSTQHAQSQRHTQSQRHAQSQRQAQIRRVTDKVNVPRPKSTLKVNSESQLPPPGFRVSGFGFRISGFGFRVSGFWFGVQGSTKFNSKLPPVGSHKSLSPGRIPCRGTGRRASALASPETT